MSNLNSRTSSGIRTLERTNLVNALVSNGLKANGPNVNIVGFESGEFNKILNENGELQVNDILAEDPISATKENGIVTLDLKVKESEDLLIDSEGQLQYVPDVTEFPIVRNEKTIALVTDVPFGVSENGLTLFHDNTLTVKQSGELSAVIPEVKTIAPITKSSDGAISLDFGKGLEEKEGKLVTNIESMLKPLGALTNGGLADISVDEALSLGFNSLADLTDGVPDTDLTLLRLQANKDDFTQKGNRLNMKSHGDGKIPYYGVFDGLNSRDVFKFNETLSTLSVPHVELASNFSPKGTEAINKNYLAQYIQGKTGGAIDVSAEVNNRRELSIRTDATLAIDSSQNLSVNPVPLSSPSIRVVDGKFTSGLTFQPTFGLALENQTMVKLSPTTSGAITFTNGNTIGESLTASKGVQRIANDFSLNLSSSNSQILVDNEAGTITGNIEVKANSGLSLNQNLLDLELQGSEHIQVAGNKISTDLKPYTAGQNITISNNTISATVPQQKTYSAGPGLSLIGETFTNALRISAGLGITVVGSAETGYVISSQAMKSKRTDDDEDTVQDDTNEETFETTDNPEVVEKSGMIPAFLPPPLVPLAPIAPIPLIPVAPSILTIPYLLGGLGAAAAGGGLFGTIWGYEKERRKQKNSDGTDKVDSDGNPIYELDEGGNYIFDPLSGTQIAIISDKTTRVTRLLFDSPPEDIRVAYGLSGMNLDMAWQFEEKITRPFVVESVSQMIAPLATRVTVNEGAINSIQSSLETYVLKSVYNTDQISVGSRLTTLESNSPISVSGDILKTGNVLSLNPYQTTPITIKDLSFNLRRIIPYNLAYVDSNPSTLVLAGAAYGNGTYVFTQSVPGPNAGYRSVRSYFPELQQQRVYLWLTAGYGVGTYNGTTKTTMPDSSTISGEWAQVQLPVATVVASVRFRYRNPGLGAPTSICVLGSNDGTTWSVVVPISSLTWANNDEHKWLQSTNSTAYLYLRTINLATTNTGYIYSGVFIEYFAPYAGTSLANSLSVQGNLVGSTSTFSGTISAVAPPTSGEHLINKLYGDSLYATISNLNTTNSNLTALTTRVSNAETQQGTLPERLYENLSTKLLPGQGITHNSDPLNKQVTIGFDPEILATQENINYLQLQHDSEHEYWTRIWYDCTFENYSSDFILNKDIYVRSVALAPSIARTSQVDALNASMNTSLAAKQDKLSIVANSGLTLSGSTLSVSPVQNLTNVFLSGDLNTNRIICPMGGGVVLPSKTTRSTGTRIVLFPQISTTETDYAIGIGPSTLWQSVPNNTTAYSFKWYGGTAVALSLDGTGNLTATGTVSGTNITTMQSAINNLPSTIYTNLKSSLVVAAGLTMVANDATSKLTIGYDSTVIATKSSVDSVITSANALTSRVSATETNIGSLQSSKQDKISVGTGLTMTGSTLNYDSTVIATKSSVDSVTSRVSATETSIGSLHASKQDKISVWEGLTLTGATIGYNEAIIATKASVDSVTSRVTTTEGQITTLQNGLPAIIYTNLKSDLAASSGITLTPNDSMSLITIGYDNTIIASRTSVDSLTSRVTTAETNINSLQTSQSSNLIHAGTGLTKTGQTVSILPDGTFTSITSGVVNVTNTTGGTSVSTCALKVSGGVSVTNNLYVTGSLQVKGQGIPFMIENTTSATTQTSIVVQNSVGTATSGYLGLDGTGLQNLVQNALTLFVNNGKPIQLLSSATVNVNCPIIMTNITQYGPPTFTTRSTGTKLVLYGEPVTASQVEYAFGISGATMWSSVPTTSNKFNWYGGTTSLMTLTGTGLILTSTTESDATANGALQVAGGVRITKALHVGASINVNQNINTGMGIFVKNTSPGSNAYATISVQNDIAGTYLFMNSSTRTTDGGINTATLRNDSGDLCLQGKNGTGIGLRVYGTSNVVSVLTTADHTPSIPGSAAFQVAGGASIAKSLFVGGNSTITGDTTVAKTAYVGTMLQKQPNAFYLISNASQTSVAGQDMVMQWQFANFWAPNATMTNRIAVSGYYKITVSIPFTSQQVAFQDPWNIIQVLLTGVTMQVKNFYFPLTTGVRHYTLDTTFLAHCPAGSNPDVTINASQPITTQNAPTNNGYFGTTFLMCELYQSFWG